MHEEATVAEPDDGHAGPGFNPPEAERALVDPEPVGDRPHQLSLKGRSSTLNDQAERSWCATCQISSAIAVGRMKKSSGALGNMRRVQARSMTASITR